NPRRGVFSPGTIFMRGSRPDRTEVVRMPDEREWVLMLRARSTIRLRGDPHIVINSGPDSTGPLLAVRVRNSFSKVEDRLVVTGLFIEARGKSESPESAVERL